MLNLIAETTLLVHDANGDYAPAPSEVILEAAHQVIDTKMQRGEKFVSPAAVKDYLGLKLAGYEHEVFAILMLDNQHRLIAYSEMFRGDVAGRSAGRHRCSRSGKPQQQLRRPGNQARDGAQQ